MLSVSGGEMKLHEVIETFHPVGSHMGRSFMVLHLLYCAIKWTMNVKQAE